MAFYHLYPENLRKFFYCDNIWTRYTIFPFRYSRLINVKNVRKILLSKSLFCP